MLEWIKSGGVKRRFWSVLELAFQNSMMDMKTKYILYQCLIAMIQPFEKYKDGIVLKSMTYCMS